MSTAVETRKNSSKSESYLQRKFDELAARIHRIDLAAHLLVLLFVVLGYGFLVTFFDSMVGTAATLTVEATRWTGFAAFIAIFALALIQTCRCAFASVNPYYVAHLLEQTMPDAKNGLVNWLDLHDEVMPSAFQKNLSARAAEQWKDADVDQCISTRGNWLFLAVAALPALGLAVFLILNPPALGGSLLRAFLPWYAPPPTAQTRITMLQPSAGDAEVKAKQSLTIVAKIDGRIPRGNRSDAPRLWHRNQPTEDFQSHALRQDYDGNWVGQLSEKQIGIGAVYKLSAGDAETREYSVRVRTETHVKKHEVIYDHPPYRKPPRTTASTFPNPTATHPIIAGPRGTQAQLIVHPSRAVKTAVIEMDIAGKQRSTDMQRHGQQAFAYQWMLEQPGRFRILLTAADGEPNVDRDWRPMSIEPDDAPAVVLTSPVRDVSLPKNAALEIEGYATSRVGVKRVTLHVRIVGADASRKLAPIRFRPGVSFQRDDGTYPNEIAYLDVVPLDQLKNERGTIILPEIGDEIEVWLEAIDAADYHNGAGNVARTAPPNRKVKIAETPTDPNAAREQLAKNQAAQARKKSFDRQQDQSRSEEKKGASNSGGPNQPSPEQQLDQVKKDNQGIDDKIKQALDQQKQNQGRGSAKEREQPDAKAKDGPSGSSDAPQPQPKDTPNKDDAGANKDQGKGAGGAGQPRDNGDPSPKKDNASKGDRKDGPMSPQASAKDAGPMGMPMPVGGAKDAGPMGMNTPMPAEPKDQTSEAGAPMASAKDSPAPAPSTPMQASAKGIDQNGPETSPKDAATPMGGPPEATSKAGMMPDAASDPKTGPNPQAADSNTGAGTARSDDAKSQKREPSLSDLAKAIEQLPEPNARGDEAGAIVAGIAKNAADPRVRDIAKEALKQNGRDAKSGKQEKKGPNPFGTLGTSPGMSDEVKAIAANREFISRIHQLQFDDWRKLVTPDLLKRAGVSEADWQKRLKSNQQYRELVRELNAKLFKEAAQKELRGAATVGGAYRPEAANSQSTLEATGRAPRPAVFQDAERRYSEKR